MFGYLLFSLHLSFYNCLFVKIIAPADCSIYIQLLFVTKIFPEQPNYSVKPNQSMRRDSNPQSVDYKSTAVPLSHPCCLAGTAGFEPATKSLTGTRSTVELHAIFYFRYQESGASSQPLQAGSLRSRVFFLRIPASECGAPRIFLIPEISLCGRI